MKNIYLLILAFVLSVGGTQAQNSITLEIDHRLGGAGFAFDTATDQDDYVFDLSRLQYYVSRIKIEHDGGTLTTIEDTWLLVDANGAGTFDLGIHDIEVVEGLRFTIGVGQDVNHNDPASWPTTHPLYPQNPSMHWGWASGYRFVCMEGHAGPSTPDNLFEIHALGDDNYNPTFITLDAAAMDGQITIPIIAEYSNSLIGIDVSSGLINHAIDGVSIPFLQNFNEEVFSAGVVNSLEENEFDGSMTISPNPSEGQASLQVNLPEGENYGVNIIDLSGRSVHTMPINTTNGSIDLPTLSSGLYIIELLQADKALTAQRWVVK